MSLSTCVLPLTAFIFAAMEDRPKRKFLKDRVTVPVGHLNARSARGPLHRSLQLRLLRWRQGRGEPPVCAKVSAAGPYRRMVVSHPPTVWGSRLSAAPIRAAGHPWSASHTACQRSRSRAVGARYSCSRTTSASTCHRRRTPSRACCVFTAIVALPSQCVLCSA